MGDAKKTMDVVYRFAMSRDLHPKYNEIEIGKYTISPIPVSNEEASSSEWQYILSFKDEMVGGKSLPNVEARFLSAWLSLMLRSTVELKGGMINTVKTHISSKMRTDIFEGYKTQIVSLPDLENYYELLQKMPLDIQRQIIRACEVYNNALSIISTNTTFSFYLLSISIECLSNPISRKKGTCEKFIDFILTYLPDEINNDLKDKDTWINILKEIYYRHRSGFTHGGKFVPDAVAMADGLNRPYVRNTIEGKEVLTPGLKWFEKVVFKVLVNFLLTYEHDRGEKNDIFKELSLEQGVVNLKAKKKIKPGQMVTTKDVEIE